MCRCAVRSSGEPEPVRPLPGVERRAHPVLRPDRVEPDRGDAQAVPGGRGVEQRLVGPQRRDGVVDAVVDDRADLQALRVAAQQGAALVEPLVPLDVPALALDPDVTDAQVREVRRVFGELVDDGRPARRTRCW